MQTFRHRAVLAVAGLLLASTSLRAGDDAAISEARRGVNPDMLSGGLFAALDAEGAFGPRPEPPRARASYADLSKGRPPAVLDARVGLNIRLGDDPDGLPAAQRGQTEPHIVRSFADTELLLAAFQEGRFPDSGALNCGYAVSRDGGFTWTRALIPNLTPTSGGRFVRATDPVAGAGPQGDLYLQTLVATTGTFGRPAVVLNRSTDGGETWSSPFSIYEPASDVALPDKNWLAVNDQPGTPAFGRLVSTWTNFNYSPTGTLVNTPILASVSDDRGATWSAPVDINPQVNNHQGTQPVFLPDGSLVVPFIRFIDASNVARFTIQCKRSVDGGRTFPGTATTIAEVVEGWDDPDLRDGVFLPSVAVARQTGVIFLTHTEVVAGSPRVVVRKSTDRSVTWTAPVIASDQPAGVSVMNPAIAVTPDGLTVAVVFIDKRHATDGRNFVDHYAAISFDGGTTWEPNLRLTEMSSDIRYAPPTSRGYMLGDYMGLAPPLVSGQPFVAIWCDTRTGDSDPFTVRFVPAKTATFETWQIAQGITSADDDRDGDGLTAHAEFALGTNPRRAESGESLLLRNRGEAGFEFLWAQRTQAGLFDLAADARQGTDPRASDTPVLRGRTFFLPDSALPELKPPTGMRWLGYPVGIIDRLAVFAHLHSAVTGTLEVTYSATDSRLINLATRGRSGVDARQMIVGFVLDGNKSILLRAAGPALAGLGVNGSLADPRLTLSAPPSDLLRTNDNWTQSDATAATFARVGAFPFAANSLDAALLLSLGAQSYSATISATGNAAGIALVEAYDADPIPGAPGRGRFVNLSTRGEAGAGDNALIAGFVLSGTQPRRVLLRAIGPALASFGITGALADPVLTLFRGNRPLATNDDWEVSRSSAALAVTALRVGAFQLPAASLDAALLITLAPGAYTAVITSADGGTGIALVEVYDAN